MTPNARKVAIAAAFAAAVALSWSTFVPSGTGPEPKSEARAPLAVSASTTSTVPAPSLTTSAPALIAPAPAPVAPLAAVPLGSNEVPDLRAGAEGGLQVDAHTRDELEKLIALNDRPAAQALLQRLESVLPPVAYRQAVDAYYAFQNYGIAAAQIASPALPVGDEASALQQLDALHALRVQQFGPEVAQAYFGDEEATARRLIDDMRAQPGSGSTFAERAEQSQRTLSPAR